MAGIYITVTLQICLIWQKLAMQKTQCCCHGDQALDCPTSAVSCRWASLAAPKCWVSSSFSKAYWQHGRQNRTTGVKPTAFKVFLAFNVIWDRDRDFRTSLAFFWRSTIWERRCVISSCCLEASSVFLASSSAREEICRLASPGSENRCSAKYSLWPHCF